MVAFSTMRLPVQAAGRAPDGSEVRPMLALSGGSVAHFELAPGKVALAVTHRTVEEVWYCLGGRGEMWRKQGEREEIVPLDAGVCLTIPLGVDFQFRSFGHTPLVVLIATMPPWPGPDEAYPVPGKWDATVDMGG